MSNYEDTIGAVFADLVHEAFRSIAGAEPVLLTIASSDGDDGTDFGLPAQLLALEHQSASASEWSAHLGELVGERPVLAVPPWGHVDGTASSSGVTREIQELMLLDVAPGAGGHQVLGVLLPLSSLTSERSRRFRSEMSEGWQTVLVVDATGVLSGVHPSFQVAFLLFRASEGGDQPTKFFRVPRLADADDVRADFVRLMRRHGGEGTYGYVVREGITGGDSLAFEMHDPEVRRRRADLAGFGGTRLLGDLFAILPQARPVQLDGDACDQSVAGAMRFLSGRDLLRDGTLDPADTDTVYVPAGVSTALRVGDLLMRTIQDRTDEAGFVVCEVRPSDLPAAVGRNVIGLRPKAPLTAAHRQLLLLFLRSRSLPAMVHASSTGRVMRLTPLVLRDLVVPEPDAALSAALEDLASASARFDSWSRQAQELLLSAFESPSATVARGRLLEEGRNLRLKAEAAALVDDFDFRVRTQFPYPIAHRWRTVEAFASGHDLRQTHEAILDTFEVLLCYAAMLALVMARNAGVSVGATLSIRDKLSSGRSGPGLGDWIAVLEEMSNRTIRHLPDDQPLGEVRVLLTAESNEIRRRLTNHRQAQAHLRRYTEAEFVDLVAAEADDLRSLMDRAAFLTDLPLLHVAKVNFDSIAGKSMVTYRRLMGDHPVVPYLQVEQDRGDLETGSLYVADHQGGLHLLRPFLIGRDCPRCNTWSTFHADRTSDGVLWIKSLEHGHALEAPELVPALSTVGLM